MAFIPNPLGWVTLTDAAAAGRQFGPTFVLAVELPLITETVYVLVVPG
jgi:hypothetical protein